MSSRFEKRKQEISRQLSVSDSDYSDLSPKGSVDEGIKGLVDKINTSDGYVTTSSCAGRVAVFLEGGGNEITASNDSTPAPTLTSQGGKGGGSWLYVSHDPIDVETIEGPGEIFSLLGLQPSSISRPLPRSPSRFVHLKFEPLILHILTSSLQHAQYVYSAAMSAGFRESGIGGVTQVKTTAQLGSDHDTVTPMVAVRTAGLAFDSIIAYQDAQGIIRSMVSEDYLRVLLRVANERFKANEERKQRFADAMSKSSVDDDSWEPSDVRKARKRAEGLRKKEALAQADNHVKKSDQDEKDDEINSLDTFLDLSTLQDSCD